MNEIKEVSIVIPTFNRASLLQETLESCLQQTFPCEIIVCDHGSTDNTKEIAAAYGKRIQYLRREQDFGPHFCWLDGVLHAKNKWIHLQFDDDMIAPEFIESCVKLITPKVGMVFSDYIVFDNNKNEERYKILKFKTPGVYPAKYVYRALMKRVISPGCCLFQKNTILNNLFVNEVPFSNFHYRGVGPDILFGLSASVAFPKIGYIPQPLALFRKHEGSITIDAQSSQKKQSDILRAYQEVRKYAVLNKLQKKYRIGDIAFLIHGQQLLYLTKQFAIKILWLLKKLNLRKTQ